ncbi:hypothetical protein Taro_026438 [Colocasia esculenta]|uniref:Uncharacterized protein n=1 Tax=Colocasia esculenta TaxID=4460 RepID=A0A843VBF9_COLES|nr:hypothetical protein [Colocasia esculenta]
MAATAAGAAVLFHLPGSSRAATCQCVLPWKRNQSKNPFAMPSSSSSPSSRVKRRGFAGVQAFYNPLEDPIFKEVLKEPVAFMGGMFAGLLRLDLNEEPLKEWITRTVEAAGITEEEISTELKTDEDAPQQIEIE